MTSSTDARQLRILMLLTDAYGGHGGISVCNRDMILALSEDDRVGEIVALPRLAREPLGPLPSKLRFDLSGLGGGARYLRAASALMFGGRFDLVLCTHLHLLPLAVVIARWMRAPSMLLIHGIEAWQTSRRKLVRLFAKRADHLVAVSKVTLDRFRSWVPYRDDQCTLMPNAIHLDAFGVGPRNSELARRLGVEGRQVVMTFGRLAGEERRKGFDEVLDALPALVARHPDLIYLIAGDGPDRARLEAKSKALGMSDNVRFTGFVDEAEKADLYRLADAYVMPSRGEGFGFVLLEAMACGVPTVGSISDGTREALRDGALGALVDPQDQGALVAAIEQALAKPKAIPEGLAYFSFPEFGRRLRSCVGSLVERER